MLKVAVLGAGGKMGCRVSSKIDRSNKYDASFIEISDFGIQRLRDVGIEVISKADESIPNADVVVFAIPDILIKKISRDIIPMMKTGALVIGLDPAAAHAQVMPIRDDLGYFVVHPHHPYLFNDQLNLDALHDYFGGVAEQDLSCALYKGDEKYYAIGEEIARIMFAPVAKTFRLTVQQMVICEPGLVESVGGPLVYAIKLAYEAAVKLGVPKEAAYSFMMGHLRVQFAITFEMITAKYSDGAVVALNDAMSIIFQPGWLDKMMTKDFIDKSVDKITGV